MHDVAFLIRDSTEYREDFAWCSISGREVGRKWDDHRRQMGHDGPMAFFGPKADKVLERGSPRQATLVGIRYEYTSDDVPRRCEAYTVRLHSGQRFGVAQAFDPAQQVRLGMPVVVRELDGKVVIDGAATMAQSGLTGRTQLQGWRPLKNPPEDGIDDDAVTKATRKGAPGTFVVTGTAQRDVFFGLGSAVDLEGVVTLPGEEPYAVTAAKIEVPPYASHLPVVGRDLVCAVGRRLDKPAIDWAASAMRHPGVGEPAVELGLQPAESTTTQSGPAGAVPVEEQIAAAADSGDTIGGITIDTFAAIHAGIQHDRVRPADCDAYAVQFGVAPGAWTEVETQWHAAIRADWRVGAVYGEAISTHQRALKQRR